MICKKHSTEQNGPHNSTYFMFIHTDGEISDMCKSKLYLWGTEEGWWVILEEFMFTALCTLKDSKIIFLKWDMRTPILRPFSHSWIQAFPPRSTGPGQWQVPTQ